MLFVITVVIIGCCFIVVIIVGVIIVIIIVVINVLVIVVVVVVGGGGGGGCGGVAVVAIVHFVSFFWSQAIVLRLMPALPANRDAWSLELKLCQEATKMQWKTLARTVLFLSLELLSF